MTLRIYGVSGSKKLKMTKKEAAMYPTSIREMAKADAKWKYDYMTKGGVGTAM